MEESKIRPSHIDLDNRSYLNNHARKYAIPCIEIIKLLGESATQDFDFKKHRDNYWLLFTKYDNEPFVLGYLCGRLNRMHSRYRSDLARKWAFHWMMSVKEYAEAMFHGNAYELFECGCGFHGNGVDMEYLEKLEEEYDE